jgi:ArsR family transcriptional regulator
MVVNRYNGPMPTSSAALQLQVPDRVKGCCQPVAAPIPDAKAGQLAEMFKVLGDPTRVQIVHILAAAPEPVCACDFTASFDLGQPTISHHLAKLREAGIVESSKQGIWAFYRLSPSLSPAARAAIALIP